VANGGGDGAAGSYSLNLNFTNESHHACTLYGFPDVSWVAGDDGHQVNAPFVRQGSRAHVTLKPDGVAHSMLILGHYQVLPAAKCNPVAVRGLRVYPPGETKGLFLAQSSTECSTPGVGTGIVHAVEAGAGESAG
jgi:hypothetical protein